MSKPVDKIEFWKERIDTAVSEHYSVYVANEVLWNTINEAHEKIIKEVIGGGTVLDAGCAYGRSSVFFDDSKYTGIDFSPDFIELAKKKYPNKTFIAGDLKELPFGDKSFDWAFCISIKRMIIDNLGDEVWSIMEKELKRVAKNVLILEYGTFESKEDTKETMSQYEIL